MLIIQHIWSHWTKAARGADARIKRPRLAEAYELPPWEGEAEVLRHEISLFHPSPERLQTKWPAHLPSPLFALRPGDIARIDWNGRLRRSMWGANLSAYYERHTYWLAFADAPAPRLFLDAVPRKHIDLRTEIH